MFLAFWRVIGCRLKKQRDEAAQRANQAKEQHKKIVEKISTIEHDSSEVRAQIAAEEGKIHSLKEESIRIQKIFDER